MSYLPILLDSTHSDHATPTTLDSSSVTNTTSGSAGCATNGNGSSGRSTDPKPPAKPKKLEATPNDKRGNLKTFTCML